MMGADITPADPAYLGWLLLVGGACGALYYGWLIVYGWWAGWRLKQFRREDERLEEQKVLSPEVRILPLDT